MNLRVAHRGIDHNRLPSHLFVPEKHMVCTVLIIEDSDADYESTMRAARERGIAARFIRCRDGDEALDFLFGKVKDRRNVDLMPCVIVVDLNLPGTSGEEVLQAVKADAELQSIPVAVFTSSENADDVRRCYRHGANCYIVKPETVPGFKDTVNSMLRFWLDVTKLPFPALP